MAPRFLMVVLLMVCGCSSPTLATCEKLERCQLLENRTRAQCEAGDAPSTDCARCLIDESCQSIASGACQQRCGVSADAGQ